MNNQQHCFCGVTEQQLAFWRRRSALSKWQRTHLRWYIADRLPGVSADQLQRAYKAAFDSWQAVCGLVFEQTKNYNAADFIILTRQIDGANGTLAEHQLPPGDDRPLRGWFDVGERWDAEPPLERGKIDLVAVACHEFGHGIGLDHTNVPGSLLNPYYDPAIRTPQADDIKEAQRRYGPPIAQPEPDPEPPPQVGPFAVTIEDTSSGVIYGPTLVTRQ
mgnify:CR=1 FL=1